MRAAFENATSKESRDNKFTIGHPCATPENVRLFIRAMYEGWQVELMDPHAEELLTLADLYGCETIAIQAVEALKRCVLPFKLSTFADFSISKRFGRHANWPPSCKNRAIFYSKLALITQKSRKLCTL